MAYTYDPYSGVQWQFVDAAGRGDTRSLETLMQRGANIDAAPHSFESLSGFPPLWTAAEAGRPQSVKWLLEHGADPNRPTSDSWPLAAAEQRLAEATEVISILKAHGAKNLFPK